MQKIKSIEGLRGILALWVVLGHTLAAAGLGEHWRGPFKVLASGGNAVDVFIVISGFVIFYLLDTSPEGYARFIVRRGIRLYPVYLLCLLASLPMLPIVREVFSHAPWPHSLNDSRVKIAQDSIAFLPEQMAAHLAMVHSTIPQDLLPSANYAILGQAWSLSLEWQFYVIAPALFWAFTRGGVAAISVIAAACCAHFLIGGSEGMLPRHIPMFAMGIACYFAWRQRSRLEGYWLMPTGVGLAYLLTHSPGVVIWTAVFLSSYSSGSAGAQLISGLLELPICLRLGKWSYSIYLSHTGIMTLIMWALERAGAAAMGQWLFFATLLSSTLCGTLLVSAMLYHLVEAPSIAIGRRLAVARATVTVTS